MFENIFSEQNLNLLLKQSFTLKENSFLCGYRSYISKQPFTVQSQFLTTYELRQRTTSVTKLHEGTSHPGSLEFTNHLLAQTRCNVHYGLEATISILRRNASKGRALSVGTTSTKAKSAASTNSTQHVLLHRELFHHAGKGAGQSIAVHNWIHSYLFFFFSPRALSMGHQCLCRGQFSAGKVISLFSNFLVATSCSIDLFQYFLQ